MGISIDTHGGICHIALNGALAGRDLPALRLAITALVDAFPGSEIDLCAVDAADEEGVRLLLALKRRPDTRLRFVNHSRVLLRALERMRCQPEGCLAGWSDDADADVDADESGTA